MRGDDSGHAMTISRLRLSGAPTRLVATATLVLVTVAFTASQQASAQAHKTACATHARHGSHACSTSKGSGKGDRRHARGKSKVGTHHAKHHGAGGKDQSQGEVTSKATCSDGTDPAPAGEGAFTCTDGSEPGCEEGFNPVASSDGSTLLCKPETGGGEEAEEPEEAEEES